MSYDPHGGAKALALSPSRWFAALHVADSVDDLISVTRQFVEACSARELQRIPSHCRPGRIRDIGQIRELARLLAQVRAGFGVRLVDGLVIDRVAAFFEQAMHQAARLAPAQMAGSARRQMS